jgi:3-(3-hydroxy-phenyl)propionate hydroxylase
LTAAASGRLPGRVDVVVVGGGPVGLVTAGLLGAGGVSTLAVERKPTTSDTAKAISVDDESLRTLQRAGLDRFVYPIVQPGTGTRYYGADGRLLVHAKGRRPQLLGHPFKSSFAQPDLERALADAVASLPSVRLHFSTELVGLSATEEEVRARFRLPDGSEAEVVSSFLVGCDGAKSVVRSLLGLRLEGRSFEDLWLVADTVRDTHRERYAMHFGDPSRPRVVVPGRDGRCRYELKLRSGEVASGGDALESLAVSLIRRYRTIDAGDIERCTAYRFHALVAERWRLGRVFLAGDAAHLMPPFAGQGLNSGIRDADNLAWKLQWVVEGRAAPTLLDTYEAERRGHAEAMVRLSVRLGRLVMTSDRWVAAARDAAVRAACVVPACRRFLAESRYRPTAHFLEGFVAAPAPGLPRAAVRLVGRMLPQPRVLTADAGSVLLDDVLSDGCALVAAGCTEGAAAAARSPLAGLGCTAVAIGLDDRMPAPEPGVVGVGDVDGRLQEEFGPLRGTVLLVRPDRYVAAAWRGRSPAEAAEGAARVVASLGRFLVAGPPTPEPGPGGEGGGAVPAARPDRLS